MQPIEQPRDLTVATPAWIRPQVILPVFVPLALLGGLLPSFSLAANLYVVLLGGVLTFVGLWGRMPRHMAPVELEPGVVWWLLPIGIFVAVESLTYFQGSTHDYPTLSLLADPLLEGFIPRMLAYFGWLAVFWGLVRR